MGTKEGPAVRAPSMNFACGAGRCTAEQREELSPLHVSILKYGRKRSAAGVRLLPPPALGKGERSHCWFRSGLSSVVWATHGRVVVIAAADGVVVGRMAHRGRRRTPAGRVLLGSASRRRAHSSW